MNLVTKKEGNGKLLSEMAPGDTFKVAGSWYMVVGSTDDLIELLDDSRIMAVRVTNGNLITFADCMVEPTDITAIEGYKGVPDDD